MLRNFYQFFKMAVKIGARWYPSGKTFFVLAGTPREKAIFPEIHRDQESLSHFKKFFRHISWKNSWMLFALGTLFLSGCSHYQKDGRPLFDVDETRIGNAVPKFEKRSRSGNKDYTIRGNRYRILNSGAQYDELGYASWYGTKFHKRRTSSGERYNMFAMTAAHRTLPLPTYAYVTNMRNGKKVIVKINDRGPFSGGKTRLIDLSYVAAKKLGMMGHGTARVRVTAIQPGFFRASSTSSSLSYPSHRISRSSQSFPERGGSVYLHVAAFNESSRAEQLRRQLQHLIHSAPVQVNRKSWFSGAYHVQVGPVRDEPTYKRVNKHLKRLGFNAQIVRG